MQEESSQSLHMDERVLELLSDSTDVGILSHRSTDADSRFKSVCEQLQKTQAFAEHCILRMNAIKEQQQRSDLALIVKEDQMTELQSAWRLEKTEWKTDRKEMNATISNAQLRETQLMDTIARLRVDLARQSVLFHIQKHGRVVDDKAFDLGAERFHQKLQGLQEHHRLQLDINTDAMRRLNDRMDRVSLLYERQQMWMEDTRTHDLQTAEQLHKNRRFRAHASHQLSRMRGLIQSLREELHGVRQSLSHFGQQMTDRCTSYQPQLLSLAGLQAARKSHVAKLEHRTQQLEERLRNERQLVAHMDHELKRTIRSREREEIQLVAKLDEQKEFFNLTIALKNGLLAELHAKKLKFLALEKQLTTTKQAKAKAVRACWHLKQQMSAMQQAFLREMEKYAAQNKTSPPDGMRSQGWTACDWTEFAELISVFQEEVEHACTQPPLFEINS